MGLTNTQADPSTGAIGLALNPIYFQGSGIGPTNQDADDDDAIARSVNSLVAAVAPSINKLVAFASMAAMLAVTQAVSGTVAVVSPADRQGAGSVFVWTAHDQTPSDGGIVFQNGAGTWRRSFVGALHSNWFGSIGDGLLSDQSAWANALAFVAASGSGEIHSDPCPAFYRLTASLTLPPFTTVTGPGPLKMVTNGQDLFVSTNTTDVSLIKLTLAGAGGSGYQSGNAALNVTSDRVKVRECSFIGFPFIAIQLNGGSDFEVTSNVASLCASFIRLRGVFRGHVSFNNVSRPNTPAATFTTIFYLDSTNGHALGYCTDVDLVGNVADGFPNSQAFIMHAGERIRFIGNDSPNCLIGVSVNPFNLQDRIDAIDIIGHQYSSTTDATGAVNGNYGVSIQGDPNNKITNVRVLGGSLKDGNRVGSTAGAEGGAIVVANATRVQVNDVGIVTPYGSGVLVGAGVTDLTGNLGIVDGMVAANGRQDGLLVNGPTATGAIRGLRVNGGGAGVGVHVTGLSPDLSIDDWTAENVTTRATGYTLAAIDGLAIVAPAATLSVKNIRTVIIATSGQVIATTNFTNAIDGQAIDVFFLEGDTNRSFTRANAYLDGSADIVSNATKRVGFRAVYRSPFWTQIGSKSVAG